MTLDHEDERARMREQQAHELARWLFLAQAAFRRGEPESGFDDVAARAGVTRGQCLHPAETVADRMPALIGLFDE